MTINRPERLKPCMEFSIPDGRSLGKIPLTIIRLGSCRYWYWGKAFCTRVRLIDSKRNKRRRDANGASQVLSHEIGSQSLLRLMDLRCRRGGWHKTCDIRIFAEHAECGIAETRWKCPPMGCIVCPAKVSLGHALEIALWEMRVSRAQRGYESVD